MKRMATLCLLLVLTGGYGCSKDGIVQNSRATNQAPTSGAQSARGGSPSGVSDPFNPAVLKEIGVLIAAPSDTAHLSEQEAIKAAEAAVNGQDSGAKAMFGAITMGSMLVNQPAWIVALQGTRIHPPSGNETCTYRQLRVVVNDTTGKVFTVSGASEDCK